MIGDAEASPAMVQKSPAAATVDRIAIGRAPAMPLVALTWRRIVGLPPDDQSRRPKPAARRPRRRRLDMKIHGHPWSTNTRKVLMTLAEKGHQADFSLVMVPKGEHKRPEFLALHPFGKIPVLEDDGFVLYETRAITAYLDEKLGGPRLVPEGARGAAVVAQWTNVADAYLVPHV